MRLFVAAITLAFLAAPAAAEEWWEAETAHFVIKSRDSKEATREFAEELERFDGALRSLQNMPLDDEAAPANKLTVYRFGNQTDIARMAGSSESGVAGFFISNAGQSVAFVPARKKRSNSIKTRTRDEDELGEKTVLQHEYTHFFMLQHFPAAYPSWYVEGYAELMGTIVLNEDGSFFVGEPPLHRAYQLTQMQQFKLEDMLDSNHEITGLEAYQFYATGWALTHYLNFKPGRLAQLNEYLAALGKGEDSLTAAKRIFGDLREIDKELKTYVRNRMPGFNVKPNEYQPPKVELREMSAAEGAVIKAEMLLRRGVDKDDAQGVLSDARSAVARYPDDYHAQAIMAEAAIEAKNADEAERIGALLTEKDPSKVDGWLIRGDAAVLKIEKDPAQAEVARKHYAKAATLDGEDPRPLIGFYYTYFEAKAEPTENAILALEDAFEHGGTDVGYRLLLTYQLVNENRMNAARTVLLPVAFRGHDQGEKEESEKEKAKPSLAKLLKLVTAGDRDASLAMIDKMFEEADKEDEGSGG